MKFSPRFPLRCWIFIFSCLAIAYLAYSHFFDSYEFIAYDARMRMRPAQDISSDIVLIEISEDTLKTLGKWPLPREFHVALIKVLRDFGAKQVIFDLLFSEPQAQDESLAQSINAAGNVILPLAFEPEPGFNRGYLPMQAKKILAGLTPPLEKSHARKAHINIVVDSDGKVRRVPLFIKYRDKLYAGLGLAAALDSLGMNEGDVEFRRGRVIIDKTLILPVLPGTSLLVNYPDIWVRSFTHLSYFQVLKAYTDLQSAKKPVIDLSILKGKTCFVGLTATGTVDLKPTPLENVYPMLGLQASVYNSIIKQRFISAASNISNALLGIGVFIVSVIFCLIFPPWKSLFANIILGILFFAGSTFAFIWFGLWINLFLPLFIIATTYTGCTIYKLIEENKKRLLLEKELEIARSIQKSFLPKNIESFSGLSIASYLEPAKFVAGDFFDIVTLDEKRLGVFIGDVAGKGVSAALIMAETISLFRVFCRDRRNPAEVLVELNSELFQRFSGRFVTCAYMIIDIEKKELIVSAAGHHPFLLFRKSSRQVIEGGVSQGVPLGLEKASSYQHETLNLETLDKVVLFTDGFPEARNRKNTDFGTDNLKEIVIACADSSAKETLERIKDAVFRFCAGAIQHDDMTLIVLSCDR